jgi:hypothetical protein
MRSQGAESAIVMAADGDCGFASLSKESIT